MATLTPTPTPSRSTAKSRLMDFLYNEDRAIASALGAQPQETISSEAGRLAHKELWATLLASVLNDIQSGHCDKAVAHATTLDKVDDGFEG